MLPLFVIKANSRRFFPPSRFKKTFFLAATPEGHPASSPRIFLHYYLSSLYVENCSRTGVLNLGSLNFGLSNALSVSTEIIV